MAERESTTDKITTAARDAVGDVSGAGAVEGAAAEVGEQAEELVGVAKHVAADATEQVAASVTQLRTAVQDDPRDTRRQVLVAAAVVGLLLLVRSLRRR